MSDFVMRDGHPVTKARAAIIDAARAGAAGEVEVPLDPAVDSNETPTVATLSRAQKAAATRSRNLAVRRAEEEAAAAEAAALADATGEQIAADEAAAESNAISISVEDGEVAFDDIPGDDADADEAAAAADADD